MARTPQGVGTPCVTRASADAVRAAPSGRGVRPLKIERGSRAGAALVLGTYHLLARHQRRRD
ncbi:hypothetical protein AB0877_10580 [Micromonospora sp. NPDC047644]|uniref:hypothetical protein n=1 Tax=Micromonospora sp. NPDC047644 TaxID=3157203 RepID=UPI003455E801